MDVNNLQTVVSSSTFKHPLLQIFPFQRPIIKYVIQNPTGAAWKKLIKTCKYFFLKYPLYPIDCLTYELKKWNADGEIFNSLDALPKSWLYGSLKCISQINRETSAASKLIKKILKCNLRNLHFYYQNLSLNDYRILTSSGTFESLCLNHCSVKYSDGTVTMDKLFDNIHSLEKFQIYFLENSSMFQKDTVKKMVKILSGIKNMLCFELHGLDETFDIVSFVDYILNNEITDIWVYFCFPQFPQLYDGYKQMLENFIDKLIMNPPKKLPNIYIPGFDLSNVTYQEYEKLWRKKLKGIQ